MRLENKVAIITGGTSGIGEAAALLFAREGAKIAITGRNEARGHAVTARILESGGRAIFLRTDVRKARVLRRRMGFADRHQPERHVFDVEVRA